MAKKIKKGTEDKKESIWSVGIAIRGAGPGSSFEDERMNGTVSCTSNNYYLFTNCDTPINWDGTVTGGEGTSKNPEDKNISPNSYRTRIYWNSKPIDTVEIKRSDSL